jgi:methionine sulfoxide reductase heme-binding subunit
MSTAASLSPMWFTARAAGITALMLASVSVGAGLLLGARAIRGGGRPAVLRAVHEAAALATIVAILVHGVALVFDPWLKAGVVNVVVPFAVHYRPLATGLGQIAALGILTLGPSFYIRQKLGAGTWKKAHRWIVVFWGLAVLHGVTAGTDGGTMWYLVATSLVVVPAVFLLIMRWNGGLTAPAPQRR